jgi:hypothetical protein
MSFFGWFPVVRMAIFRPPPPPRPGKASVLEKMGVPLCTHKMIAKADTRHNVSQITGRQVYGICGRKAAVTMDL